MAETREEGLWLAETKEEGGDWLRRERRVLIG